MRAPKASSSWYQAAMRTPATIGLLSTLALALGACGPSAKKSQTHLVPPLEEVQPQPTAAETMVSDLAGLHIDRLGNPVLRWDHIPPVLASKERPHKLLVLLVEYPDQGFERFAKDKEQGTKLRDFYQEELFDESYQRVDTLSHYYLTQSLGTYHVTGQVLAPVTLPRDRRYYGSPSRPAGGSWRDDSASEALIVDALAAAKAAYPDMNWRDFDRWDPEDIDGDKRLEESDGYLDHFVVVFAGGGQSSCEGLYKVRDRLTTNVQLDAGLAMLTKAQRSCADRMWPHRSKVKLNDGRGPSLAGTSNLGGGIPVSDDLWIRDYNMQSEYTDLSTFIHEFGHSIGLPDVYARTSSNSTGSWDVMSGTTSPSPQNMSAWSRLMLGWLKPQVIIPPSFGGVSDINIVLKTLDDPATSGTDATRAAMIILPPKEKHIELTAFPKELGTWALYTGQGNDLDRTATLDIDLRKHSGKAELSFDAWWEIEGGWDFAYLEMSSDAGQSWTRLLPTDLAHMPAKHGHDGKTSLPGFTGLSGDLDGDGKNESIVDCDPSADLPHGEDRDPSNLSPCLQPSWVRPSFDLSVGAGKEIQVRLRYYTDGAAVMRGMLIDNVRVAGIEKVSDFESEESVGWTLDGFSRSTGSHDLLVPHFYLVEYRNPYAPETANQHRYDHALAEAAPLFYANPTNGEMMAVQVRNRPGVVLWYYNGAFAWSENDPASNGPGLGYLLVVDANTSELKLPGLESLYRGEAANNDTHYEIEGAEAQTQLAQAFAKTVCFVRDASYLPDEGLGEETRKKLGCGVTKNNKKGIAPAAAIEFEGKTLQYSYQVYNELLPGKAREAVTRISELLDTRKSKEGVSYRLRDRVLRSLHTKDAPFSAESFDDALRYYSASSSGLEKVSSTSYAPQASFDDSDASRYLNSKLPFGGAALPTYGLSFSVAAPTKNTEGEERVEVQVHWTSTPQKDSDRREIN